MPWWFAWAAITILVMGKRILAAVLWFFAGWYLGAFIAVMVGAPDLLGPALGLAGALFFAGDPLGVIWTRADVDRRTEAPAPAVGDRVPTI